MSAEPRPTPPPATPSHVQSVAPPKPQFTPAQMLADNISTRMREFGAFTAISLFVYWKAIPGLVGAAIIAAIVLPIEITRQLAKVGVARLGGGGAGAAAVLGVVALHKALTWGAVGIGGAAIVASLAACAGTGPAMRTSPVLGYYQSPDWGKCVVGGARVESAGSVTVTAHGCVRADRMDAGAAPIEGFTPLGGTRNPFAADAGAE